MEVAAGIGMELEPAIAGVRVIAPGEACSSGSFFSPGASMLIVCWRRLAGTNDLPQSSPEAVSLDQLRRLSKNIASF